MSRDAEFAAQLRSDGGLPVPVVCCVGAVALAGACGGDDASDRGPAATATGSDATPATPTAASALADGQEVIRAAAGAAIRFAEGLREGPGGAS